MSLVNIPVGIHLLRYEGATLTLADQTWKTKLTIIHRPNTNRDAWSGFNPSSGFNSVTQLVMNEHYYFLVKEAFALEGVVLSGASSTTTPPATAAPTISSFSPTSAQVGQAVTITGTGFTGATRVRFAGLFSTFTVLSDTTINATVPDTATNGKITVETPNGNVTSAADFTVSANPITVSTAYAVANATATANPNGTVTLTWEDYIPNEGISLLSLGVPNDAILAMGSTNFGTDGAHAIIQNLLNQASPANPLKIYWDAKCSLSDTLIYKGNTTINFKFGCGAILKNGVNKPMFMNANRRFSQNSNIVDENVLFNGFTLNGNGMNQTVKGTPQFGLNNIISSYGVRNFKVRNAKYYTPKLYACHAINIENGFRERCVVDVGAGAINMDGLHFDGWSTNCYMEDLVLNTYDDGIAFNADDGYDTDIYADGAVKGFYPNEASGPITNFGAKRVHFKNSLFGGRVLSVTSRVTGGVFEDFTGSTRGYGFLLDNYWQVPDYLPTPGRGNIGTISIKNMNVVVTTAGNLGFPINEAILSITCNIESLTVENLTPTTNNIPTVFLDQNYDHGTIMINGVKQNI